MTAESLASIILDWGKAAASVGKCILRSQRPFKAGNPRKERLVLMANGPSLRKVLDTELERLADSVSMSVNFAANSPEFATLKPDYYVLADPHFFRGIKSDPNVRRLWDSLKKTDWPMTLFLPAGLRKELKPFLAKNIAANSCITVKWFNLTPGEGAKPIVHRLYRAGLAMPRPRNVLIAALMIALREGFRDIAIIGADHTWSTSLSVDDNNRVVSVQPHFYKDKEEEKERVANEYAGYHLHDILGSMTIAFKAYHDISDFADTIGAGIVNATPGSFIDAFPRSNTF